jgi:DNA-binding transcriptional LysR family regulator
MFNLEWYRIFLHTARSGNFTKAAQQLHVTQPSVSYAIKQMEETLGLKLFHRLSKGVEMTEEGRALLQYVEQSFALLDAAEKHVLDLKQLTEGEIRIGASDSLIKHLLLPQLNLFHSEYPNIRIRLTHGKTPAITQRLKDGLIDCAIVHMPIYDPLVTVQKLAMLEDCFVVGEGYRGISETQLSANELAELPLLLHTPGSSTREFIEQWFAVKGLVIKPDIELGSVDLLVEFAKQGYGAAFTSRSFVEQDLLDGKLFELRIDDMPPPRSIGLAVRRDMQLSIATERFVRLLQAMTER